MIPSTPGFSVRVLWTPHPLLQHPLPFKVMNHPAALLALVVRQRPNLGKVPSPIRFGLVLVVMPPTDPAITVEVALDGKTEEDFLATAWAWHEVIPLVAFEE